MVWIYIKAMRTAYLYHWRILPELQVVSVASENPEIKPISDFILGKI